MSADLNRRILDLLGVPQEDRYASHATLELRPDCLPELTLHYHVVSINSVTSRPIATCHELRPVHAPPVEPFDLDKLVNAAQQRLTAALDSSYAQHKGALESTFETARIGMSARWKRAGLMRKAGNRGHAHTALLQTLAGVLFFVLALGWLGPQLEDRTYSSYGYTPAQPDEAAQFDAEARARCARHEQDNTGYIATAAGGIICTDKRGRKLSTRDKP